MSSIDRQRTQNPMKYGRVNLRAAITLGCMAGLSLTAFGSRALAGDNTTTYKPVAEGSTLTQRSLVDTTSGEVYIYVGGSFPVGTHPLAIQFLYGFTDGGSPTSGFITPLLFERTVNGAYVNFTVVGVGF